MSETAIHVTEASAALGSKATITGGLTSFGAFLAGVDWLGWAGIGGMAVGLIINFFFSWQRNQREKEIHKIKLKQLNGECNVKDN